MDSEAPVSDAPQKPLLTRKVLEELGLVNLYTCSRDVKNILFQRFVRMFAHGGTLFFLAVYLHDLDYSDGKIGQFMTLTLVGDIILSVALTIVADGIGRRVVVAGGAALMLASGAVFALCENYYLLLIAAIFGIISPSGDENDPFRAIEESTMAWLTPADARSDLFAWYGVLGFAGAALGILFNGWLVRALTTSHGFSSIEAYRVVFIVYAAMGFLKLVLSLCLSSKVESPAKQNKQPRQPGTWSETDPLLPNQASPPQEATPKRPLLPRISKESRIVFMQLSLLFMLDSFASGLVPMSWKSYFFKRKFSLQDGTLGTIFSITAVIGAASMLVSSAIAKRIGNIKAMVFTNLPSAIALALIPLPSTLAPAVTFLVLRAGTQSMDVAPRTAFLSAILRSEERTAIMGTMNAAKTGAQSIGPLITGLLADADVFWVSFVAAGVLKVLYNLGLLGLFAGREARGNGAGRA